VHHRSSSTDSLTKRGHPSACALGSLIIITSSTNHIWTAICSDFLYYLASLVQAVRQPLQIFLHVAEPMQKTRETAASTSCT